MIDIMHVDVEPVSDKAFAPFGQLIGLSEDTLVFQNPGLRSGRLDYQCVDATEAMFIWFDHVPMAFSKIERHFNVTQSFIPLDRVYLIYGRSRFKDFVLEHRD